MSFSKTNFMPRKEENGLISMFNALLSSAVHVPKDIERDMPKGRLLTEAEWRALGVQQGPGWVHYDIHKPEPWILLFRRPKPQANDAPQNIDEYASADDSEDAPPHNAEGAPKKKAAKRKADR